MLNNNIFFTILIFFAACSTSAFYGNTKIVKPNKSKTKSDLKLAGEYFMRTLNLMIFIFFIASCGQHLEHSNHNADDKLSDLKSEKIEISLVFKDELIVCYSHPEAQELSCLNKNKIFPIFMNINDNGAEKTLKIPPQEEIKIFFDTLESIERKQIELWDECKLENPPKTCKNFD